jgi:pyruvate kinase
MITSGMNVARLNFSHGSRKQHQDAIKEVRSASEKLGKPVAVLQDLSGRKIRVGRVREPGVRLEPEQEFVLTNQPVEGTEKQVSVSYYDLPSSVKPDDRILLADGMMELVVKKTSKTKIYCDIIIGGILTSHKGINLPTGTIKGDSLTAKDKKDLLFGLKNDVDYVAMSFVRTAEDIRKAKGIIRKEKKDTPVIAKIEKHEALKNIDDILGVADGIMVARGDLGVEIPPENVPGIQKMLVKKANDWNKPVIIATQMLRSMVDSPRPTRAEAADVANAVLDGADALMLSEETAIGNFPLEALRMMVRIAESVEKIYPHEKYLQISPGKEIAESVAHTSCILASHLDAVAIVAPTRSGSTAVHISRFRPKPKIIALSPEPATVQRLALCWGCMPIWVSDTKDTDERIEKAAMAVLETGEVSKGELVVVTSGQPAWLTGSTDMMKVIRL